MGRTLTLGGKTLRCIDTIPLGLVFDLAEAMEDDNTGMKAIAGIAKALRTIVVKEDRVILKDILDDTENPVSFDELNTAMGNIMAEYGKRPTAPPSRSPSGASATSRSSRVVSLWRDTGKVGGTSSQDGKSLAS
jgi:hypothetical protein